MKLAISASENNLDSSIDLRFGRAKGFIIYDISDDSFDFIDNVQNLEATQGAGIQSAQNVINKGVDVVITGHCGPKAFRVLSTSGIKVYAVDTGKLNEIVEKFKKNELKELGSADVEGHWM